MSSKNSNLGYYDMVLALSENKINQQFSFMHRLRIIKHELQFMCDLSGTRKLRGTDKSFGDTFKSWLNKADAEARIAELADQIEQLEDAQDAAADDDTRDKLRRQTKALREQRKTLAEQLKETSGYELAVHAVLDAPVVEIIDQEYHSLMFRLRFKSGSIYYRNGSQVKQVLLDSTHVYSFTVPVGKIRITAEQMMLVADEETNKTIREGGFSDQDFTIESLLMNFQNAKVAAYDERRSKLPDDVQGRANLQVALSNYFRELGLSSDNPYILGYAISKNLKQVQRAMFHPLAASYSTSRSSQERASSFNFLMLTRDPHFPTEKAAGILARNLAEHTQDKTSTVDGVIAVDFSAFSETYIKALSAKVLEALHEKFTNLFPGYYQHYRAVDPVDSGNGGVSQLRSLGSLLSGAPVASCHEFWFSKHDNNMGFVICQRGVDAGADGKLDIWYDVHVRGALHLERQTSMMGIGTGTVGVDQGFSTCGAYEANGRRGRQGKLRISIVAGAEGRIVPESRYEPPAVGWDTEKAMYRKAIDEVWDTVSSMADLFKLITGSLGKIEAVQLNARDVDFDSLGFDQLASFSDKVILPGSNVYTFKNIRLLDDSCSATDAVLFDISYAPVS